jgi:hypothetical protein
MTEAEATAAVEEARARIAEANPGAKVYGGALFALPDGYAPAAETPPPLPPFQLPPYLCVLDAT